MTGLEYRLMHRDIPVADISFDVVGHISSVDEVLNKEHMPPGTFSDDAVKTFSNISRWWSRRGIPISRDGLEDALNRLGVPTPESLMTKSLGLSLSDCYWICPIDSDLIWKDVNYFDNEFSEDIGDILLGSDSSDCIDFGSPDSASDGTLKKRWKIINGDRVLVKGSTSLKQEPFNEVIASTICDKLGIEHVPYDIIFNNKEPFSICKAFTNSNIELIPIFQIISQYTKSESETIFHFTNESLKRFGIDESRQFMNQMITLDYIIANEDRHLGNFGVLRNPDTLEVKGFAPIYDNGTSLGNKTMTVWINEGYDLICRPFKATHSEQIQLVDSFDWLHLDKLDDIEDSVLEMMTSFYEVSDPGRPSAIAAYLRRRINSLERLIEKGMTFRDDKSLDLRISRSLQ